jgi:hypothetical protein
LLTIAEKLQGIRAALDRMAAYYTEEENGEAMGLLGQLDTQVKSISTGAIVFGRSPDEKHASAALTGFVRPWNGFRNGVQALRLCCPIPIPVTADTEGEDAADDAETGKAAD